MYKAIYKRLILITILVSSLLALNIVLAQDKPKLSYSVQDPLAGANPQTFAGGLIKTVLGIVGSLALVMIIYAGFQWMTARGNSDQVGKAQQTMMWAFLGLAMIFGSYIILSFLIGTISK